MEELFTQWQQWMQQHNPSNGGNTPAPNTPPTTPNTNTPPNWSDFSGFFGSNGFNGQDLPNWMNNWPNHSGSGSSGGSGSGSGNNNQPGWWQQWQDWWNQHNGNGTGGNTPPASGQGTGNATPQDAIPVPGKATPGTGQMNVVDYAGQLVNNPSLGLTTDNPATANVNESMFLSDRVPNINENAAGTSVNGSDPKYQQGANMNQTAAQGTAQTQSQVDPRDATGYTAQQTQQNIANQGQATAQQGQVGQNSQIDAPQLDMQGSATGTNTDGSTNYTGQALKEYASQNISNIIDTSTPSGQALAQALGEGNYTDSKATLKGQLDILQSEFVDQNGQPKIPGWAAGTARNVAKIASFRGMTGTAATAAMAQALMEASIPIAQQDAQFFQTVTLQNLSNKQAATINRANVLAKFDLTNLDNRMAAAVENAKSFLAMDMKNLDNAQQTELVNTQNRVQSILEDAKAVNAQRLFGAEQANDMAKFYDNLNASISQFNTGQQNGMSQFNANATNSMSQFNATLENARQEFYKNMQYNIDLANAKWRQDVTMQEAQFSFEAAATDVKNMVNISQEQLNQIWDRSDAMLDYLWKSSENEKDRKNNLLIAKTQAQMQIDAADAAGLGSIFGSIAGSVAGGLTDWLF